MPRNQPPPVFLRPTFPRAIPAGQQGDSACSGNFPDPLIPFYDPYDAGDGPVATPFNVAAATTQGVWVDIAIPANQTAGTYTGTITVSGSGIGSLRYPITLWNGSLPAFNDLQQPNVLKA